MKHYLQYRRILKTLEKSGGDVEGFRQYLVASGRVLDSSMGVPTEANDFAADLKRFQEGGPAPEEDEITVKPEILAKHRKARTPKTDTEAAKKPRKPKIL